MDLLENENGLWQLPIVSTDNAYQLGLTVATMVNAALQEIISQASTENTAHFHSGILDGLRQAGFDVTDIAWPQENNGKKRIVASRATDNNSNQPELTDNSGDEVPKMV